MAKLINIEPMSFVKLEPFQCELPPPVIDSDDDDFEEQPITRRKGTNEDIENDVDSDLFQGMMQIVLDETKDIKSGYEELLTATNAENVSVSWYHENMYRIDLVKDEDDCVGDISAIQLGRGSVRVLLTSLQNCLLAGQFKQAAHIVWGLAALSRHREANIELLATILKAAIEVFLNNPMDSNLSANESPNSSMEAFINALMDTRGLDPREVGIEWIQILLTKEEFQDMTKFKSDLEEVRKTKYKSKTTDPKTDETFKIFQALTAFASAMYLKNDKQQDDTLNDTTPCKKNVTFAADVIGGDMDEEMEFWVSSSQAADKTKIIAAKEIESQKNKTTARSIMTSALTMFESSLFTPGTVWDTFLPEYLFLLTKSQELEDPESENRIEKEMVDKASQDIIVEALIKYKETHPSNPNADKFIINHLLSKKSSSAKELNLLKETQIAYNKAVPMDKEVAFMMCNHITDTPLSLLHEEACIILRLLDYPQNQQDATCWAKLNFFLGPADCKALIPEIDFFIEEWFESRLCWWPPMHFGEQAARRDMGLEVGTKVKLIKLKTRFLKFTSTLHELKNKSGYKEFSNYKSLISMANKCENDYNDFIERSSFG